jgi:hypothetical protein
MSRMLDVSPWARQELGAEGLVANEYRARKARARVVIRRNVRRNCWYVAISRGAQLVTLSGSGDLAEVLDAAWQDFETAVAA